ncbi:MAG: serine hydrolase [Pseudomonadota bacterium]
MAFKHRLWSVFLALAGALTLSAGAAGKSEAPTEPSRFAVWNPDENRVSEQGAARIRAYLEKHKSASFLVIYKGKIAFQYGDIHKKHLIHSMRKPLLSILYGQALSEGQIALDEPLSGLGLEEPNAAFTESEGRASVEQLLQSRSGVYLPAAAETEAMTKARPARGSHEPGEQYYYNNWSFNSLGTLFEQRTGTGIFEAFEDQLAKPLGMIDYAGVIGDLEITDEAQALKDMAGLDGYYSREPERSRHPAYHFRLSAHDLALIGQLLVQGGQWNGQTLVDPAWIKRSTQCASVLNPDIGGGRSLCYGLMWRVIQSDNKTTAFMHTGLGAHMIYVYPSAELVLIHRADTENPDYVRSGSPQALIGLTFGAFSAS